MKDGNNPTGRYSWETPYLCTTSRYTSYMSEQAYFTFFRSSKGSFENSLKKLLLRLGRTSAGNLLFKIKKNTDILTLFGFEGIYFIKINDFRKRISANIHMIIKNSGYRSWRNMISSGNRSKCLVEVFQIL